MYKFSFSILCLSLSCSLVATCPIATSTIENARIENIQDNQCELVWDYDGNDDTTFLIFGSNSNDFSEETEDLIASSENHFIAQTTEKRLPLEPCLKFYRVVANSQGQFSNPSPPIDALQKSSHKNKIAPVSSPYVRNPHVSDEVWNMMQPYFLPANMPEKAILDTIFKKRRVLRSTSEMGKAGFILITNPKDKIIVAKHPKLKGYLVKVYLDSHNTSEWIWWKKRVEGVRVIQASINKHGYQSIMKTPKKWVYPLPAEPSPESPDSFRKNFILVVEAMDILDSDRNRSAYKKKMTPAILDPLYTVIMENLLIDSVYCDNTPFCEDGRLAFIDTEHSQDRTRPVPIWTVAQYLSKSMYAYWEQLVQHGVQK